MSARDLQPSLVWDLQPTAGDQGSKPMTRTPPPDTAVRALPLNVAINTCTNTHSSRSFIQSLSHSVVHLYE
jgi:hypothetical protein